MKKYPRLHEYPADHYADLAEFRMCRRIAFWHAVVAWTVTLVLIAGFVTLGMTIVAMFRA